MIHGTESKQLCKSGPGVCLLKTLMNASEKKEISAGSMESVMASAHLGHTRAPVTKDIF